MDLLDRYAVDAVFDVGANVGMSGLQLRRLGFAKRIVSFEPVKEFYERCRFAAAADAMWSVENVALGERDGECEIHVTGGHGGASSLLEMTENVTDNEPDQRVTRSERIAMTTLEAMMGRYYPVGDRLFLKMDVRGYGKAVLTGGLRTLDRVVGMRLKMSLVRNYLRETLCFEVIRGTPVSA